MTSRGNKKGLHKNVYLFRDFFVWVHVHVLYSYDHYVNVTM